MSRTRRWTSPAAATAFVLSLGLLTVAVFGGASARGHQRARVKAKFDYTTVKRWWEYEPKLWRHGWRSHPPLPKVHKRWHRNHPKAGDVRDRNFHDDLVIRHRRLHHHRVISKERGIATWYDADGATGACGEKLKGMYAAHKTLPCGSLVSVRAGGKYVFVRILDRGPYGKGRILDLSKDAFKKLAPTSAGVLDVRSARLKP